MGGLLAAGGLVTDFAKDTGVALAVALVAFAASISAAALSFALGRWNDSTAYRREGYAAATRELVAWAEYPFRIRRRTSDDPAVLSALAERGHAHQEALRYRQTWIRSENRWVATVFAEVRAGLASQLGPCCNDAWSGPPIHQASGMTLNGWGPHLVDEQIGRFERATGFRFGWRRIPALLGFRPGA